MPKERANDMEISEIVASSSQERTIQPVLYPQPIHHDNSEGSPTIYFLITHYPSTMASQSA